MNKYAYFRFDLILKLMGFPFCSKKDKKYLDEYKNQGCKTFVAYIV
jgi:hypothetical protein